MTDNINAQTIAGMFSVTNPNPYVWEWVEGKGYGRRIRDNMREYSKGKTFPDYEWLKSVVSEWNNTRRPVYGK